MRRVLIDTDDGYLFDRILGELSGKYECALYEMPQGLPFDIIVSDREGDYPEWAPALRLSYTDGSLPLRLGYIEAAISSALTEARLLLRGSLGCSLDGEIIRLSSLEYSLLSRLMLAGGEFVSKAELIESVFPEGGDGMLNLYIHYLREKLEGEDKRIIISKRGSGYKINGEYLFGGAGC